MRWFRNHRWFGGTLALFALCLQMVVSLGHVHPRSLVSGAASTVLLDTFSDPVAADDQATPAGKIKHPKPAGSHGACLICTTLSLLGAAQATQPPALTVPAAYSFTYQQNLVEFDFQSHCTVFFRTRAPPVA
jgi:hypothetical protein